MLFQGLADPNARHNPAPPNASGLQNNPLSVIFSSLMNPSAAAHGDAVYTQEALDRVITQLMDANTASSAPGPATPAAIASLLTMKLDMAGLDDQGKAECSVCMDDVPVGTEVTILPCGHWFHRQCVTAWLSEHDTCPICRKSITPKAGEPISEAQRSLAESLQSGSSRFPSRRRESNSGVRMPGAFESPESSDRATGDPSSLRSPSPGPSSSSTRSRRPSGVELGRQRSGGSSGGNGSSSSTGRQSSDGGGGIGGRLRGWFNGGST